MSAPEDRLTAEIDAIEVREFFHSRKGRIVGVKVWERDEWTAIRLVGEQELRYFSEANRLAGPHPDGDVLRVRTSLLAGSRVLTIPAGQTTSGEGGDPS